MMVSALADPGCAHVVPREPSPESTPIPYAPSAAGAIAHAVGDVSALESLLLVPPRTRLPAYWHLLPPAVPQQAEHGCPRQKSRDTPKHQCIPQGLNQEA